MEKTICKAGSLCWFDSTNCGLIKIKVIEIHSLNRTVTIKVTSKNNRYYEAGEVLNFNQAFIFPRESIKKRKYGSYYFANNFCWE
jgi:hypothetical protein